MAANASVSKPVALGILVAHAGRNPFLDIRLLMFSRGSCIMDVTDSTIIKIVTELPCSVASLICMPYISLESI